MQKRSYRLNDISSETSLDKDVVNIQTTVFNSSGTQKDITSIFVPSEPHPVANLRRLFSMR